MDLRTLLAGLLGLGLGLVLVAFPEWVLRAHLAGRLPSDRGGGYGTDADGPTRYRLVVRLVGIGFVLAGAYFGWTALATA